MLKLDDDNFSSIKITCCYLTSRGSPVAPLARSLARAMNKEKKQIACGVVVYRKSTVMSRGKQWFQPCVLGSLIEEGKPFSPHALLSWYDLTALDAGAAGAAGRCHVAACVSILLHRVTHVIGFSCPACWPGSLLFRFRFHKLVDFLSSLDLLAT